MVPAFKMLSQTPTNPAYHRLNQIIMRYKTHLSCIHVDIRIVITYRDSLLRECNYI